MPCISHNTMVCLSFQGRPKSGLPNRSLAHWSEGFHPTPTAVHAHLAFKQMPRKLRATKINGGVSFLFVVCHDHLPRCKSRSTSTSPGTSCFRPRLFRESPYTTRKMQGGTALCVAFVHDCFVARVLQKAVFTVPRAFADVTVRLQSDVA